MSIVENSQLNGLPGIGALGRRGNDGKKGLNVLFGYIEDFFEKEIITIDPYVYYGATTIDNTLSYYEGTKDQLVNDYITYVVKGAYLQSPNSDDTLEKIKIADKSREIIVPTTFSNDLSQVGDLIYIIEKKSSGQHFIKYFLIVQSSMFGKSFNEILNNFILQEDPLTITSFYQNKERLLISEMYSPLRYEFSSELQKALELKYRTNFVDSEESKYAQILSEYSSDAETFIQQFITGTDNTMNMIFGEDAFKFEVESLKIPQMFITDECITDIPLTNIIKPKEIIFSSYGFVSTISEDDVNVEKGTLTVSLSKFLNVFSNVNEWRYGVELYNIDSSTNVSECIEYDFSGKPYGTIDLLYLAPEGKSRFKLISYIGKEGTAKYYSRPSILTIVKTHIKDFDKYILEAYSIEDGDSFISEDVDSGDTEYVDFSLDALSCEKSEGINFSINSREGYYIDSISFNSIPVFSNDVDDISGFAQSENLWFSIDDVSTENNDKYYKLSFKDNLPNIGSGDHPTTLNEYLSAYGSERNYEGTSKLYEYLKTKTSTLARIVLVTVVSKASKDSEGKKSYYKIIQPGFSDDRKAPSIILSPEIYNNELENSNSNSNGVLCNQFQYFIDLDIEDFNLSTWGKYNKEAKIDLKFVLDHYDSVKSSNKGTAVNNSNLCIYDSSFLNAFANNAFRVRFDYIEDSSISGSNTIEEIEKNSRPLKVSIVGGKETLISGSTLNVDSSVYESDWIYLNNLEWNEVSFRLDEPIVDGILCSSNNKTTKHKIRMMFEYANPIPSEINLNLAVERASIHYPINGVEYYFPIELYTLVDSNVGTNALYEATSGNQRFVIDPIYFTVANKADEELVSLSYKPALNKVNGSIKEVGLSLGLYGYDLMNIKRSEETERDKQTRYFNYSDFFFKVKDFQDNIKSMYISPIDVKDSAFRNKISQNTDFLETIKLYSSEKAASYNYESFEDDSRVNQFDPKSYLSLIYNANILLPKKEGFNSIVTYNDEEYDGKNYSQYENNAPLFLSQSFNLQVRSDEEISAISGWNYEYEVSKNYNKDFTIGGYTSLSGNGYLMLPIEDYAGIYDSEEIMPLEDLLLEQSQEVFNSKSYTDNIQYSSISNDYIPQQTKYWRVPVWNMNWMVPIYKYDKIQNINYIVPFRFCNPYVSFIDRVVTKSILAGKDYNEVVANFGKITSSYKMTLYINNFLDTDGKSIYINAKYNNFDCIKLLNTLTKTDYTASSIDDYDVNSLINEIMDTTDKYNEEVTKYLIASDVPDNVIRWWICVSSIKLAIENPSTYDVNISLKEFEDFRRELLDIAYSDEESDGKEYKFNLDYYEKYSKKEDGSNSRNNFIPYNLLYSVYPRIAYPEEKNRVNVIMVQQPTISSQEDYKMTSHYFSTINYSEIYPDLPEPYQCLV